MNFEKLSQLAAALDEPTEILNARLLDAQLRITELKLGVRARVPLTDFEGVRVDLLWMRASGEWGLYANRVDDNTPPVKIFATSREARAAAAAALPALFKALEEQLEKETAAVEEGIQQADAFLKAFERK